MSGNELAPEILRLGVAVGGYKYNLADSARKARRIDAQLGKERNGSSIDFHEGWGESPPLGAPKGRDGEGILNRA
jgi:hypothetical protein